MRGFCMIPHSGKHWRVWSSWSERSQINIGPSKCPARAIHSAFRKTLRTWRWMWSGILKVKLILSAQLPASPTTDILLPSRSFICGVEKLAMIFTVADGSRCFRSKKKEKKKKKPANKLFGFQIPDLFNCWVSQVAWGCCDDFIWCCWYLCTRTDTRLFRQRKRPGWSHYIWFSELGTHQ